MSDADAKPDDRVRQRLQECAAACLDHVRAVKWGMATANYSVPDGELEIDVAITVKCFRKAQA